MTSDSDKPSDEGAPANRSEAEFDEFDDFDDFDDFDEAAGLDAFDDGDDPFEDGSESEIDDLDAAAAELDAFAGEDDGPDEASEPPADQPADDDFAAPEELATDEDGSEEAETDDFAADEFSGDDFAADETADQDDAADEFEADEFEADEFEADEFTPPPAESAEPAAVEEAPAAVEDAAADEPAAADSEAEESPAEAEPTAVAPDADDDLDAMLQAQAGGDDPFGDFDEAASVATEETATEAGPAETAEAPEDPAVDTPPEVDTADLADDPVDADDAFMADEPEEVATAPAEAEMPAAEDAGTTDVGSAEEDDDLMPAAESVAGLSGDDELSQSDAAETLATEPTITMGDDEVDASAEPLVDDSADEDAAAAPDHEAAETAPEEAEPEEAVAAADDADGEDYSEEAAAAAAAASVAAAEAVDSEPAEEMAEEPAEEAAPRRPKRRSKGPNIPLIDIGGDGFDKLAEAYPKRLRAVHSLASRKLTKPGLKFADKMCKGWSGKATVPYRTELDRVSASLNGEPGAHVINLAFEMACTTGAAEDPEGGQRLLHTMDWKLDGLGRMLVAARRHCDAGLWVNFTWPGYLGCLQGIAPGRFAAAINHAPINGSGPGPVAWAMSKMKWYGQKGMPPALLLRKVFDECEDFEAAVDMIERTPICYPAIFSVLGIQDGEFFVIERTESAKSTQKRAPAVANHWLNNEFKGTVTGYQSQERLVAMKSRIAKGVDESNWLVHPILNPDTRLSVDLNPTTGRMRVRTYQGLQPSSSFLDIYAD